MITRIHVNQHNIRANKKDGQGRPVITVKTYKQNIKCNSVLIMGPSEIIYVDECGRKPLDCGARVYIETKSPVKINDRKFKTKTAV